MRLDISKGQIVISRAGRDTGKVLVIVAEIDMDNVLVSDGSLRKMENPKKKKKKHLEITDVIIEDIANKLAMGLKVSNSDIRKALAAAGNGGTGVNANYINSYK
jgi:large subunit ribosomal protein L14e